MRQALWRSLLSIAALCAAQSAAFGAQKELERTGGPYVPTPQIVVDEMLRMAKVGPKDFVVDLGSGDGVIVLTAARDHRARGYGVDIDAELVKQSNAEAKRLGVAERAAFHVQDVFKADLSKATVITLYLLPSMMVNLRSKIYLEPRPGTRIVSHDYTFDEWKPDDQIVLDVPEKEKVNGIPKATLHLWIVPAKVGGKWQVQIDGGEPYELVLRQRYQFLEGGASSHGKTLKMSHGVLRGEEVVFTLMEGPTRHHYRGNVTAEGMQGTVDLGGGRNARWVAKRP